MTVLGSGLTEARRYFQDEKLQMPFVPTNEQPKIKKLQSGLFSSRNGITEVYDANVYIKEVLSEKVANYVLFGFAGHGVNSRAIHYYAVNEHLAIFIQLGYGNINEDTKAVHDRIDGLLHSIQFFFMSMDEAAKADLINEGKRLLVVESDFAGSGWGWIEGTPGEIKQATWHSDGNTIVAALMDIPLK
jgi:hypothetical protein